jgi:hypothetical protein
MLKPRDSVHCYRTATMLCCAGALLAVNSVAPLPAQQPSAPIVLHAERLLDLTIPKARK